MRTTAVLALVAVLPLVADPRTSRERWRIKGEFSEACTCNVPCPCNFGERPVPYEYCYPMWSYWVKEGRFGKIDLRDMHIGGVSGARGTMALLDIRAAAEQRAAMEEIWHALSGRRLFCLVRLWPLKATAGPETAAQGSTMHTRYEDPRFLGFSYLEIEQKATERGAKLAFGDRGGFETRYLVGLDGDRPITVANNQSWPIAVTIKGKTAFFRYQDALNQLDYHGTNSNQGTFDLGDAQPGARPMPGSR